MEACNKALCGHVVAGNRVNGVEYVAMQKTLKGVVDKDKDGLFGQFIQLKIKMIPNREDSKIMNTIEENKKKEMFG